MGDARVPMDPLLAAFGIPLTVTPPAGAPVVTTGIWLRPLQEGQPVGTDFRRRDPRRILAIPRSAIAALPRGTSIDAPEIEGGAVLTWRVDGYDQVEADEWRVIVVPA